MSPPAIAGRHAPRFGGELYSTAHILRRLWVNRASSVHLLGTSFAYRHTAAENGVGSCAQRNLAEAADRSAIANLETIGRTKPAGVRETKLRSNKPPASPMSGCGGN